MATVEYVRMKNKRYIVGVSEDGATVSYCVSESVYLSMPAVSRGALLDSSLVLILKEDDERYRCMRKALSLLAYSDKNARELSRRLRALGFSRDAVDSVVSQCVELGYINESRQLRALILREANVALRGPIYIKHKLFGRGYSSSHIDSVMESLTDSGEIDFESNFDRLAKKKNAVTPEEKRQLAYKNGYRSALE